MAAILIVLLVVCVFLLFSGDSNTSNSSSQSATTAANVTAIVNTTASTMNTTTQRPVSHCSEAALFLSWLNPVISGITVLLGVPCFSSLIALLCSTLAGALDEIVWSADQRMRDDEIRAERARTAATDAAHADRGQSSRTQASEDSLVVSDTASEADSDAASDAETMVDVNGQLKQEAEQLLKIDPICSEPVIEQPEMRPRPAISAMDPDQIRTLSKIFVQCSALTFVLIPFAVFIACLLMNNWTFCTILYARFPKDLLWMLWVIIPAYIAWSYVVVAVWGEVLAVILGKEKDRVKGDLLNSITWKLAFVAQPVLVTLWIVGEWLFFQVGQPSYRYVVDVLYQSITGSVIGAVERRVMAGQRQSRSTGGGDTVLLPINRDG